jgi:hypothetical protein
VHHDHDGQSGAAGPAGCWVVIAERVIRRAPSPVSYRTRLNGTRQGRIWSVKRRRLWLFAILVYVGLDLCLPAMPGAFVFDPDGSVESVDVARARVTSKLGLLPPLAIASLQSPPQLRDFTPSLPSNNPAPPPGHFMTRYLPRATCAPPPPSEDLH